MRVVVMVEGSGSIPTPLLYIMRSRVVARVVVAMRMR